MSIKINLKCFTVGIAIFYLSACDFEVVSTTGGKVVSDPSGIDCRRNSGNCIVENYENKGDGLDKLFTKLTAIPDEGYFFNGWKGSCLVEKGHLCFVKMSGNIHIEANFEPIVIATDKDIDKTVRFLAIGDMGEGNHQQFLVAQAFKAVCETKGGCDFVIGLGDNIYDEQPYDIWSSAFDSKFEIPYRNVDIPFFMSLGNHDNDLIFDGTGASNYAGEIQVAYHYRTDKASNKWIMPSRYYHFAAPLNDLSKLIDFYALDSNPMNSGLDLNPTYEIERYKSAQANWLATELAAGNATWKIAYSHHPYISNGKHGNAGNYDGIANVGPLAALIGHGIGGTTAEKIGDGIEALANRLSGEVYRQWFEENVCGKVDVFFSGHDHDLQVLQSVPECGKTIFVVSGAAAKTRNLDDKNRNQVYFQQGEATGFMLIEANGNRMQLKTYTVAHDGSHTLAFEKQFLRRNK